jgi:hypothetical protein
MTEEQKGVRLKDLYLERNSLQQRLDTGNGSSGLEDQLTEVLNEIRVVADSVEFLSTLMEAQPEYNNSDYTLTVTRERGMHFTLSV